MKTTTPEDLLKVGAHLGHKKQKVHPKSRRYIYKIESGVSIIDLFKTADKLQEAKEFVRQLGVDQKVLLFVATKKTARDTVGELCAAEGFNHMTNKWIAGFLTNFQEISKNIKEMRQLRQDKEEGNWKKFVKHEQTALEKKLNRIASIYHGVEKLDKKPDAIFVVDAKKEKNAITEADTMDITTIGIVDTNCDPGCVKYTIPANDDAIASVKLIAEAIVSAYAEGLRGAAIAKVKEEAKTEKAAAKVVAKEQEKEAKKEKKKVTPKKPAPKKTIKKTVKKAS